MTCTLWTGHGDSPCHAVVEAITGIGQGATCNTKGAADNDGKYGYRRMIQSGHDRRSVADRRALFSRRA